jgi:hypothetical protein
MADHLDFADNGRRQHYDDKDYPRRVRAIRAIYPGDGPWRRLLYFPLAHASR